MSIENEKMVIVGRFGAPFGVRGWCKVNAYTDPIDNILHYSPWFIQHNSTWEQINLVDGKLHGKVLIVKLPDCDDRDRAQTYTHREIAIKASQLPPTQANEYYWSDLMGCQVINQEGQQLGVVEELITTGANDVLVIKTAANQLLHIPFIKTAIMQVDLAKRQIFVDWQLDW